MSTVDDRVRGEAKGESGGKDPARRPIPLPPASLRPPPRVRPQAPLPVAVQDASSDTRVETAGQSGVRRGFLLGLLLPVMGLGIAGFLWWQNRSEGVTASDIQVRARVEQEPRGSSAPVAVPEPESGTAISGPAAPAPAEGLGMAPPAETGEILSIQIASFRTRGRAERVLAEARARTGLEGVIIPARVDGVRWYRILLGAFTVPEDALGAAGPLLEDGMITEILVRPVPERWIPVLTGGEGSS